MDRVDLVRHVIELDEQLRAAFHVRDFDTIEQRSAPEFTLNGPSGRIQTRQQTIDLLKSSTSRQTQVDRVVETAYAVDETIVVIMGRESLVWEGTGTERDGVPTARRFTNVWLLREGVWQNIARQATTVAVDGSA